MEEALATANPELQWIMSSLEGVKQARYLALASFALLCYEHILTFDQELEYFWSGSWTKTRALFLANRYFPLVIMILTLVCLFVPNLSLTLYVPLQFQGHWSIIRPNHSCKTAVPATITLVVLAVCIVQAIIVIRIWYLYSNNPIGRLVVLVCYVLCTIASFVVLGVIWDELKPFSVTLPGIDFVGCAAPPATHLWRIYVISLIIHTILYIATTIPAVRMRQKHKSSPLMNLILREGGVFYLVVFVSVGFSAIGAIQSGPSISLPAIYSNFMLCTSSVAVSRLMLRLQTLAAGLHLDSRWLLNNAELSRVRWRKGAHDGELIVEVDAVEVPDRRRHSRNPRPSSTGKVRMEETDDKDLDKLEMGHVGGGDRSPRIQVVDSPATTAVGIDEISVLSDSPGVRTTMVGVYDDLPINWIDI